MQKRQGVRGPNAMQIGSASADLDLHGVRLGRKQMRGSVSCPSSVGRASRAVDGGHSPVPHVLAWKRGNAGGQEKGRTHLKSQAVTYPKRMVLTGAEVPVLSPMAVCQPARAIARAGFRGLKLKPRL